MKRLLVRITGYLLLVTSLLSLTNWSLSSVPKYWFFIYGLLLIGITHILTSRNIQRMSVNNFLIMICVIIFTTRIVWILTVPTLPISNFEFFNKFAIQISQGSFETTFTNQMNMLSYPFILAGIYKIFGAHLILAKLMNIAFSILAAIFLFLITIYLFDERVAKITVILFAFWPTQIMLNSVLASEHLYTVLLLFGLLILVKNISNEHNLRCYYNIFKSGIFLGLSYTARSVSAVVTMVSLTYILSTQDSFTRKMKKALSLIVGFVLIFGIYTVVTSLLGVHTASSSLMVASLLMGTNYDSKGTWNLEDSQIWDKEDADTIALQRIFTRMSDTNFIVFIFEKFANFWGDDIYGAYWSTESIGTTELSPAIKQNQYILYAISQFYYIWIVFLGAIGCYKLQNKQINDDIKLFLLIFLAFVLLHSFLEVQSRYHYHLEFIFLILAGYGIIHIKDEK